jgi:hypothetical protein
MEVDREAPKHSGIQVARIKNPKKQKAKRCVDQFFRSLLGFWGSNRLLRGAGC